MGDRPKTAVPMGKLHGESVNHQICGSLIFRETIWGSCPDSLCQHGFVCTQKCNAPPWRKKSLDYRGCMQCMLQKHEETFLVEDQNITLWQNGDTSSNSTRLSLREIIIRHSDPWCIPWCIGCRWATHLQQWNTIWRFPQIGVPPNPSCYSDFPWNKPFTTKKKNGGSPIPGTPPYTLRLKKNNRFQ